MEVETWWPGEFIILEICEWLQYDLCSLGALYVANRSWREVILYFVMKRGRFYIPIQFRRDESEEISEYNEIAVYTSSSTLRWNFRKAFMRVPEGMGRILSLLGKLRKYFHMKCGVGGFCLTYCVPGEAMAKQLYKITNRYDGEQFLPPICSIDVLDIENKKKRKEQCQ